MASLTELRVEVDGLRLRGHLARPPASAAAGARPGLVICHGLPHSDPARSDGASYGSLAERAADDLGYVVAALTFRGCGDSEGQFALSGWLDDIDAAIEVLSAEHGVTSTWLVGAATGGSVALCAGARNSAVRGVATLAARADFEDWAAHPRRFLEHCRRIGVVRDPRFPTDYEAWAASLRTLRPMDAARRLGNRPLLLVHGDADQLVPISDARRLAAAHGAAELRLVSSASHALRHDPRAVALLLGWLDRQRVSAGLV